MTCIHLLTNNCLGHCPASALALPRTWFRGVLPIYVLIKPRRPSLFTRTVSLFNLCQYSLKNVLNAFMTSKMTCIHLLTNNCLGHCPASALALALPTTWFRGVLPIYVLIKPRRPSLFTRTVSLFNLCQYSLKNVLNAFMTSKMTCIHLLTNNCLGHCPASALALALPRTWFRGVLPIYVLIKPRRPSLFTRTVSLFYLCQYSLKNVLNAFMTSKMTYSHLLTNNCLGHCPASALAPSTLEMFGEKISASPGSSKEIAGLLRKMMMMMMMKMTRKS